MYRKGIAMSEELMREKTTVEAPAEETTMADREEHFDDANPWNVVRSYMENKTVLPVKIEGIVNKQKTASLSQDLSFFWLECSLSNPATFYYSFIFFRAQTYAMAIISVFYTFFKREESVEVAFEQSILHNTILLELAFCKGFCNFVCNSAGIMQDLMLVEFEEPVQSLRPILHRHRNVPVGLILGIVEVHGHDTLQRTKFIFCKIVLCNRDIILLDFPVRIVFP